MSRSASTWARGAPPFAASTLSSSKKPHPFCPSLSIGRASNLRSIATHSNSSYLLGIDDAFVHRLRARRVDDFHREKRSRAGSRSSAAARRASRGRRRSRARARSRVAAASAGISGTCQYFVADLRAGLEHAVELRRGPAGVGDLEAAVDARGHGLVATERRASDRNRRRAPHVGPGDRIGALGRADDARVPVKIVEWLSIRLRSVSRWQVISQSDPTVSTTRLPQG